MLGRPMILATTVAVACVVGGCLRVGSEAVYPPAQVYAVASNFVGEWIGEIDGVTGSLSVSALGEGQYYGQFRGENAPLQLSLKLLQVSQAGGAGSVTASNLAKFTWQDGRGGRGAGWLLINVEDSALTGSYGTGDARTSGLGEWTFIRVD